MDIFDLLSPLDKRYWDFVYKNNHKFWDQKPWQEKDCQIPGWGGDKTHRCLRKFEKWYNRPRKAAKLYWWLHRNDNKGA